MGSGDFAILDERFRPLVKVTARVEKLYEGCRWAEGPAYFPAQRSLVWSDIPNDRMLRCDEATGDGRRLPPAGRLLERQHGRPRKAGWSPASTATGASPAPSTTARSPSSPTASRASASTARTTSSSDPTARSGSPIRPTASTATTRATRPRARSAPATSTASIPRTGAVTHRRRRLRAPERPRLLARRARCSTSPTPASRI